MQAPYLLVRSALRGVAWPAITGPAEATALALQYQLERSQWLAPVDLLELQTRQLDALVRHAWETVPFYRWHWHGSFQAGEALTRERFERLPLLAGDSLAHDFEELKSTAPPAPHGTVSAATTGAGDRTVRVLRTALTDLWRQALTLRDHLWHRRDFDGTLAVIHADLDAGAAHGWGAATGMLDAAGRTVVLGLPAGMDAQLEWLQRNEPDYLLTSPANAAELVRSALAHGVRLPRLREVRTFGGLVRPEVRESCRQAWGVPLTDLYTSGEAGHVALQCPGHEHYHVQSESVLVELLDRHGRACAPGAVGRIVVTTLHNFAMPLVRYDTGDLGEEAEPCECGRGLPVLRRIVQRTHDVPAAERVL